MKFCTRQILSDYPSQLYTALWLWFFLDRYWSVKETCFVQEGWMRNLTQFVLCRISSCAVSPTDRTWRDQNETLKIRILVLKYPADFIFSYIQTLSGRSSRTVRRKCCPTPQVASWQPTGSLILFLGWYKHNFSCGSVRNMLARTLDVLCNQIPELIKAGLQMQNKCLGHLKI